MKSIFFYLPCILTLVLFILITVLYLRFISFQKCQYILCHTNFIETIVKQICSCKINHVSVDVRVFAYKAPNITISEWKTWRFYSSKNVVKNLVAMSSLVMWILVCFCMFIFFFHIFCNRNWHAFSDITPLLRWSFYRCNKTSCIFHFWLWFQEQIVVGFY